MFSSSGLIEKAMTKRGYKHRRTEDQFTIRGQYARNLQYVYSKEKSTKAGLVVDLIYFAADVLNEKLVIGLYRENADMENGVYVNTSRALDLKKFSENEIERMIDQLVTSAKDKFN